MTPEKAIEHRVVKLAKTYGAEVRKVRWIGRNGAPDRIVMLPDGRVIWIEFKAPGKRPTLQQQAEHARMRAVGQTVLVIDSVEGAEGVFI